MTTLDSRQLNNNNQITDGVECTTQAPDDNSKKLASTEYVEAAVAGGSTTVNLENNPTESTVQIITNPSLGTSATIGVPVPGATPTAGIITSNILNGIPEKIDSDMLDADRIFLGDSIGTPVQQNKYISNVNYLKYIKNMISREPIEYYGLIPYEPDLDALLRYVFIFNDVDVLIYTDELLLEVLPIGFEFYIGNRSLSGNILIAPTGEPLPPIVEPPIIFSSTKSSATPGVTFEIPPNGNVTLYKEFDDLWHIQGDIV